MLFQNTQKQIHTHDEIVLHGDKIENVDHFNFLGWLVKTWLIGWFRLIGKNLNWKKNAKCKKIAQLLALFFLV